ncbi:MAG TPA: hypothetical protein VF155_06185 [Candidatus Dormibacteraeota bacterium]
MSEEPRPSTQPHGQRRSDGAPAWWAFLDRGDLPPDGPQPSPPVPAAPVLARSPSPARAKYRLASLRRKRNLLVNTAALLVALLVVMLGIGVDSARGAVVAALIFGVPMLLVAVVASIAARRAH